MAELPKYRAVGVGVQPFEKVDYTNLQNEMRRSGQLDAALDKLMAWSEKKMYKQAEIKGEAWAAQNPITDEQLSIALNTKGENERNAALASLVQGDVGTITGAAINKVQAGQLRAKLELHARKELSVIGAFAETGEMSMNDAAMRMNAMIGGLSNALAASGPEGVKEAESLRASLSSASQPVFNVVAARFVKRAELTDQTDVQQGIDGIANAARVNASAIATATDPVAAENAVKNFATQLTVTASALKTSAISANFAAAFPKIDAAILGAKKDAIATHLLKSGMSQGEAMRALGEKGGNIGSLQPIYAGLDADDRAAVRNYVRDRYVELHNANETDRKDKITAGHEALAPYIDAYMRSEGKDESLFDVIVSMNVELGYPINPSTYSNLRREAASMNDPNYVGQIALASGIRNGTVKGENLVAKAAALNVPYKHALGMYVQITSREKEFDRKVADAGKDTSKVAGGSPQTQAEAEIKDTNELANRLKNKKPGETDDAVIKQFQQDKIAEAKQKRVSVVTDGINAGTGLSIGPSTKLDDTSINAIVDAYKRSNPDKTKVAPEVLRSQLKHLRSLRGSK